MNIYSDDIYSEVIEFDAVYNNRAAYNNKRNKNYRRAQRKAKQAQRDRFYDGFWTVHQITHTTLSRVY